MYLNVLCWSKVKWPFLPMFGIWQDLKWIFHYLLSPYDFQGVFLWERFDSLGKFPLVNSFVKNMLMSRKILSIKQMFEANIFIKRSINSELVVWTLILILIWPHFLCRTTTSLIPTPSPKKPRMILFLKKLLFWMRKD